MSNKSSNPASSFPDCKELILFISASIEDLSFSDKFKRCAKISNSALSCLSIPPPLSNASLKEFLYCCMFSW